MITTTKQVELNPTSCKTVNLIIAKFMNLRITESYGSDIIVSEDGKSFHYPESSEWWFDKLDLCYSVSMKLFEKNKLAYNYYVNVVALTVVDGISPIDAGASTRARALAKTIMEFKL
jgi:hypothetical protein